MTEGPRFVGLPLRRGRRDLQIEPFFHEIEAGLESVLLPRGLRVLRQVVVDDAEEIRCYERWAAGGSVAGVVLTDLTGSDDRQDALRRLGMPTVIIGEPASGSGASVVRTDGYNAMVDAVRRLAGLGHRRVAHVSGPVVLRHTRARMRGFADATAECGVSGVEVESDYSGSGGAAATLDLLAAQDPPTAIVYDNDVMAVAALDAVRAAGVEVPGRLSLLAWDDSVLCRLADPPLSAVSRDVHRIGALAATALTAMLDHEPPSSVTAPEPFLVERGSTAPAVGVGPAPVGHAVTG